MSPRTAQQNVGVEVETVHLHVMINEEEFTVNVDVNCEETDVKKVIIEKLFCECCVKDVKIEGLDGSGIGDGDGSGDGIEGCNWIKVVDFQDMEGNWGIGVRRGGKALE